MITCIIYWNDHRDGSNHTYSVTNMRSESVTYENFSLKEARLSTTQQEDNVAIQKNPSYITMDCSNPQVKPAAKDHVKMQKNPSYLVVGYSNPQVKPEAEDNANMEEDLYFNLPWQ